MPTKETGVLGEKIAEVFLKKNGYKILDRNYTFRIQGGPPKGEVDIVAEKDKTIVFVEVKTLRHSALQGEPFFPESKVDYLKQKKIIKASQSWLMKNKIPLDSRWQMDVIAVEINDGGEKAVVRHLKNAFLG